MPVHPCSMASFLQVIKVKNLYNLKFKVKKCFKLILSNNRFYFSKKRINLRFSQLYEE